MFSIARKGSPKKDLFHIRFFIFLSNSSSSSFNDPSFNLPLWFRFAFLCPYLFIWRYRFHFRTPKTKTYSHQRLTMTMKPNGKAIISSAGDTEQSKLGSHQRQSARAKPNGKSSISSDNNLEVISLNEISLGPQETELRFRLIHFWEVWNPLKKTLIGFEMPLIDEKVMNPTALVYDVYNINPFLLIIYVVNVRCSVRAQNFVHVCYVVVRLWRESLGVSVRKKNYVPVKGGNYLC